MKLVKQRKYKLTDRFYNEFIEQYFFRLHGYMLWNVKWTFFVNFNFENIVKTTIRS